jgi:hypothetical protein
MTAPFNLLAELLQPHERGKYLLFVAYFWTLGCFEATLIAYLFLSEFGWRNMAVMCSLSILVALIGGTWTPESPRWLVLNGRLNEAKEVVLRIGNTNNTLHCLPHDWRLIPHSAALMSDQEAFEDQTISRGSGGGGGGGGGDPSIKPQTNLCWPICRLLATPFLCRRTLLIWVVWFSYGVVYYGLLSLVTKLFEDSSSNITTTTTTTTITTTTDISTAEVAPQCGFHSLSVLFSSSSELVGLTLVIFTIDTCGRRGSQAGFLFIVTLSCFSLAVYIL